VVWKKINSAPVVAVFVVVGGEIDLSNLVVGVLAVGVDE
jgi:hypothetical protein